MKIKPNRKRGNHKKMSLDQQIIECEEKIAQLEDRKRSIVMGGPDPRQISDSHQNVDKELDREYQQIALLKIRRMMGY